jgi:hypothetical protein
VSVLSLLIPELLMLALSVEALRKGTTELGRSTGWSACSATVAFEA